MPFVRSIAVAGLLVILVALVGCGESKPTPSRSNQPSPAPSPNPVPSPGGGKKAEQASTSSDPAPSPEPKPAKKSPVSSVDTKLHELDPARHVVPATAASGHLKGMSFTPDRIELEGKRLLFRQGKEFFADASVEIMLDAKVKPSDGVKFVVKPSQRWTENIPRLIVSTKKDKEFADMKFVNEGYAMTLELAKQEKGKSAGKIYMCLPDAEKSYVAGTFTAERKRGMSEPPGDYEVPFIQGKVSPPVKKGQSVSVGYVGLPADGKSPVADGAGGQAVGDEGGFGGMRSLSFEPRAATLQFEKFTPVFDFTNLPPGRYLVFARVKDGPTTWTWVDLAAGGRASADIKLDAVKMGSVEVKVPADERDAQLVPTDLTPPPGDRFLDSLANMLDLDGEAKDGVVKIAGVPAGKYQVRAGSLRADVEVVAGKSATVELKPAKK
jgi:hypothetical protein